MSKNRVPTRKIKHDEFVSTVSRIVLYLEERIQQVAIAAVAVVVLLFGILGTRAYLHSRSDHASFLLGSALELYHQSQADPATGMADPARLPEALDALREVADQHPYSRAARIARFYAGLCLLGLDRKEEAYTALEEYLDRHPRAFNASQARMMLANLAGERGDVDTAKAWFLEAAGVDSRGLPADEVLLEMGRFLENAGRNGEAFEAYDRLLQDYPDSEFRYMAQQRSEALSG